MGFRKRTGNSFGDWRPSIVKHLWVATEARETRVVQEGV